MKIAIKTEDLYFTYPDGTKALNGIDLEIREQEFIAIIGPNGSGKSTLVKHFIALLKPTKGKVIVFNKDISNYEPADLVRDVGYVFQNPSHQLFCPSVKEELEYGLKNIGLPNSEIKKRVNKILKLMNIEHLKEANPLLLSRGEKVLVAIASILVLDPKVIILDEPTTGLDRRTIEYVFNILSELNREGKTIIFITHNMRIVAEYAKRIIVMNSGKVIMDGSPYEIFSKEEELKKIYIKPPSVYELSLRLKDLGMRELLTVSEFVENFYNKFSKKFRTT